MADKYVSRNSATGRMTEVEGTVTGGTGTQAGKIPALDAAGRLDASLMPVGIGADTATANAAEALTAGDFVYIDATGTVRKASAASGGTEAMGFILASVSNGAPATVYFEGRNTQLTGLTVGARYYLSATTAGAATATPVTTAGASHQFLGRAVSATSLSFEPDDPIVLA